MSGAGETSHLPDYVVLLTAKYAQSVVSTHIRNYLTLSILERREQELKVNPEWKKFWKRIQKRDKPEAKEKLLSERHFLQVGWFDVL